MQLVLFTFGVSAIFEFAAALGPPGVDRKILSGIAIITLSFASGGLFVSDISLITAFVLIIGFYRAINILRLAASRIDEHNLRRVAWKTSAWLISVQIILLAADQFSNGIELGAAWQIFAFAQLILSVTLLVLTIVHLHETKSNWRPKRIDDTKLPTLTVAVPARNEDEQLETCLESIIACDYPKLEVIVLDDCSQDKTSQVIRKFAHDGVRFVQGEAPKTNWLAKNQAYQRLFEESSGDIVLFCGVDVQFEKQTLRVLVETMKQKRVSMISVMPINTQTGFSLSQAFRYMWELVPPRNLLKRPPVLSTCWLIKADMLRKQGGFRGVANMITPEAFFARQALHHDKYQFARSTKQLGLTSSKNFRDQFDTAVRVRYPQMHRRPEFTALVAVFELMLFVLPYALAIAGLISIGNHIIPALLFIVSSVLLSIVYVNVGTQLFPKSSWRFIIALPAAALLDVAILNYSMCRYEFSTVDWKGRNVCIPVQQIIPSLPKIDR